MGAATAKLGWSMGQKISGGGSELSNRLANDKGYTVIAGKQGSSNRVRDVGNRKQGAGMMMLWDL